MIGKKQNSLLRLTINVDPNEGSEMAFVRAMLRRLNVMYAKTRPRSALAEIMQNSKLRDQLEIGRSRKSRPTAAASTEKKTTLESRTIFLPSPSKKVEVEVKRYDPPRNVKFRFISLKEQRFEPPDWAVETNVESRGTP